MPRFDLDRAAYLKEIDHRHRWAWRVARLRHGPTPCRGQCRPRLTTGTFRSDREAVSLPLRLTQRPPAGLRSAALGEREGPLAVSPPSEPADARSRRTRSGPRLPRYKDAQILRARALRCRLERRGHSLRPASPPFRAEVGLRLGENRFVDEASPPTPRARIAAPADWRVWDHWRFSANCTIAASRSAGSPRRTSGRPSGITEYKFYCLMGQPQFFMYFISDRTRAGSAARSSTSTGGRSTFHWNGHPESAERPARVPAASSKMLAEAKARCRRTSSTSASTSSNRRAGLLLRADLLRRRRPQSLPALILRTRSSAR